MDSLTATDYAALAASMAAARAEDAARAKQIDSKVAFRALGNCCHVRGLLRPDPNAQSRAVAKSAVPREPRRSGQPFGDPRAARESAELLKRPDPIAALARVEAEAKHHDRVER